MAGEGGIRAGSAVTTATAGAALQRMARRSRDNARSTVAIVRQRWNRRPPSYPRLDWLPALWGVAMLVIGAAILLDPPIANFNGRWPDWLSALGSKLTDFGQSGWFLIPAGFVLIAANLTDWTGRTRRRLLSLYNWTCLALYTLVAVGLSGIAVNVLKYGIGRARPREFGEVGAYYVDFLGTNANYASFPSGHATTVGAVAGMLMLIFPRARLVILPLAGWLAATRIVVGAHYPSDVIAGLAFGYMFAALAAVLFARLGYIFVQRPRGLPKVRKSFRVFW